MTNVDIYKQYFSAACTANGQGSIAYDDSPDLGMYDAVFAKEA